MIYDLRGKLHAHLEITNYCNAACPMCGRNPIMRSDDEKWVMRKGEFCDSHNLYIDDIANIFDSEFYSNYELTKVNLCGNKGDPAASPDLFEIVEYFMLRDKNTRINMATNGGLKTPNYWYRLGETYKKFNNSGQVTFGIDGLEDTNHIYRQNVNFNKVIENAQAFIEGGGNAGWQYLIFKHNEHQIEEAQKLSEKLGFKTFFTIHTPRFHYSQNNDGKKTWIDALGKEWVIETADPNFNKVKEDGLDHIFTKNEHQEIHCKAKATRGIFIDAEGLLFPCCWLGGSLRLYDTRQVWRELDSIMGFYDKYEMNVIENSLVKTLQNVWISDVLPDSWEKGGEALSHTCRKFCSKNINLYKKKNYADIESKS